MDEYDETDRAVLERGAREKAIKLAKNEFELFCKYYHLNSSDETVRSANLDSPSSEDELLNDYISDWIGIKRAHYFKERRMIGEAVDFERNNKGFTYATLTGMVAGVGTAIANDTYEQIPEFIDTISNNSFVEMLIYCAPSVAVAGIGYLVGRAVATSSFARALRKEHSPKKK